MSKEKPTLHNDVYDHDNEDLSVAQAIGFDIPGEEFVEKVNKFLDDVIDYETESEIVEAACKTFTKKELAFMWVSEITEEEQHPMDIFRQMLMGPSGQA